MKTRKPIMSEIKQEKNKFIRAWIWFWYNDITRVFTSCGFPIVPVFILLQFLNIESKIVEFIVIGSYIITLICMFKFNDYSNLRRIGMNEYRVKLKKNSYNIKN